MKTQTEINYKDLDLIIYGTYTEELKGRMYYDDMSGLPDSSSSFEISKITVVDSDVDISILFCGDYQKIEELVLDKIED